MKGTSALAFLLNRVQRAVRDVMKLQDIVVRAALKGFEIERIVLRHRRLSSPFKLREARWGVYKKPTSVLAHRLPNDCSADDRHPAGVKLLYCALCAYSS